MMINAPQVPQKVESVTVRQHHVKQCTIKRMRLLLRQKRLRLGHRLCVEARKSVWRQIVGHHLGEPNVIVEQQ